MHTHLALQTSKQEAQVRQQMMDKLRDEMKREYVAEQRVCPCRNVLEASAH